MSKDAASAEKNNVIGTIGVIVQCRLCSSRLPEKALLPLGGKSILAWTLNAMRRVPADKYIVATDYDSEARLLPICTELGWDIFAGDKDDVLARFCACTTAFGIDVIVRATADNPFLFYEAAQASLTEFTRGSDDYFTYSGLPHGSGIEILNAHALKQANALTHDSFEREHVGPALYNHRDTYNCRFVPAPPDWNHPDLRTTIDTAEDYRRAQRLVKAASKKISASSFDAPLSAAEIIRGCDLGSILCVPSLVKGHGTGHLRRSLEIARVLGADIYIPADIPSIDGSIVDGAQEIIAEMTTESPDGLSPQQIVQNLPAAGEYSLILADYFMLPLDLAKRLSDAAPLAAIDEGSAHTDFCDYLLDIIPSDLSRAANLTNPRFIALPKNRRENPKKTERTPKRILIAIGGEDPAHLTTRAAIGCANIEETATDVAVSSMFISAIIPSGQSGESLKSEIPRHLREKIRLIPPVKNLKEHLHEYDVIVTHYGLTAYEAEAAGCEVILLATTALHGKLAKRYGFACLSPKEITATHFTTLLNNPVRRATLESAASGENSDKNLHTLISRLASGKRLACPFCGNISASDSPVVARTPEQTYRRCGKCGMLHSAWQIGTQTANIYTESYFFDEYKRQYGKTYLEDFAHIKANGTRRVSIIKRILQSKRILRSKQTDAPALLDVGCAYGPFLQAASEAGFSVRGTDISEDAVKYVRENLHFPATCGDFVSYDFSASGKFDALTLWYVIEHFRDVGSVLEKAASLIKKNGVFAFSTPSASGVSGRYNRAAFFAASPRDHYTIWEPRRVRKLLTRYGFVVKKIVSTGHHPERFPFTAKIGITHGTALFAFLSMYSRLFGLGDTFEVYCVKR